MTVARAVLTLAAGTLLLGGCAVGKIVTAPIRAAGTVVETAVDATTTTRSEAEEDLGRKVMKERRDERKRREREEREERERRDPA